MSEQYNFRKDIAHILEHKQSTQVSNIYFNLIKGKLRIISNKFPLLYQETTTRLYNKHYWARLFYFKACKVWLKTPSWLAKPTKVIIDWFYKRSLDATYDFYRHIEKTLDCNGLVDKICTIESLKWHKMIKTVIDNSESKTELAFQS